MLGGRVGTVCYVIHINQFLNIKFQQYVSLETLPVFVFVFLNGAVEFFFTAFKITKALYAGY